MSTGLLDPHRACLHKRFSRAASRRAIARAVMKAAKNKIAVNKAVARTLQRT